MGCCTSKPNIKQHGPQAPTVREENITSKPQNEKPIRKLEAKKIDVPIEQVEPEVMKGQSASGVQSSNDVKSASKVMVGSEEIKTITGSKGSKEVIGGSGQQESPRRKKKKDPIYFDISPLTVRKPKQIYHALNSMNPSISKPYSTLSDWQNIVIKHQQFNEEEIVSKLLLLRNRNWVLEQIKLLNEQNSQSPSSLDSLLISRRILQLREHFNWFVWALAQFYFFFNGSSTHYTQFQTGTPLANSEATTSVNSSMAFGQSSQALGKPTLPKVGSKAWSDGFEYKGVSIKVMPYEDSQHIRNEIKALKYIQIELLELKQLSGNPHQSLMSLAQFTGASLHQEVILPLIAGVSCGGFYLYATPIIYIPKSVSIDSRLDREFSHVKDIIQQAKTPQSLNYSPSPSPMEHYDLNSSAARSVKRDFDDNLITDSMFKYMPILKRVTAKNMIPIYDYEQYPQRVPANHNLEPPMFYIMLNLYEVLPQVSSEINPKVTMMRIPSLTNEDISFHRAPKIVDEAIRMKVKDLSRFIQSGNQDTMQQHKSTITQRISCLDYLQKKQLDLGDSDLDIQADELQNIDNLDFDYEDDRKEDEAKVLDMFQKRSFMKQGWEFVFVSRKQQIQHLNENRRATSFFASREILLKADLKSSLHITPLRVNLLPTDDQNPDHILNYSHQQQHDQVHTNVQNRVSLFFRHEGTGNNSDHDPLHIASNKIIGNVLITAHNYKKQLKLKYSLCNHTYSTNIDSLFSASIDQVVIVIEKSDKIQNQQSLKELLHRKGLNIRFSWVVLAKLRYHQQRELVMIDILMRVMRKIVNEEIKLKSIAVALSESNNHEEYYQGCGNVDSYKEMVTFFINTILKRKMHKYKSIFEETLLGLFLSRMSILGMAGQLNLKKEEFFYLESKDILEDIIEAPSKNPSLFINAVSAYFKLDFKPDFLRVLRQDKFVFLAKSQPVGKGDIKAMQCRNNLQTYFSLREEAYFILARQISGTAKSQIVQPHNKMTKISGKIPGKIKTKTEKDKQGRRQQPNTMVDIQIGSARSSVHNGLGGSLSILMSHNSSLNDSLNRSIDANVVAAPSGNQVTQTFRSRQPVVHDFRQPKDSLSTIRQYQNMEAMINENPLFAQNIIPDDNTIKAAQPQILDFSKISKRNNFLPSQVSEIVLPSALYKLRTYFSNNPMYYFDDASKIYIGDTFTVLRANYDLPSVDMVDEWTIVMDSLLKDVYTVTGSEQVLLEALVYQALLIYFYKNGDSDELFKVLTKIRDALFSVTSCSPETLVLIQILTGLYFEEQRDQMPIEAEKSYLTALMCIFQLHGDPRGRGNATTPYSLFLSWKLSLLALAEDKKLHDSEFAEELFDASLRCLLNHRLSYREQQLAQSANPKLSSQLPTEVMAHEKSKFEGEQELLELQRLRFDIKKYRNKPFNVTYASGLYKSNNPNVKKPVGPQAAMNVYVTVNHHYNNNKELKGSVFQQLDLASNDYLMSQEFPKSRSQLPRRRRDADEEAKSNVYDLEPSDIDLDIEDENKNYFIDENFRSSEWQIGTCPFKHWSLYRQQISQILQVHNVSRANPALQQHQKQLYRELLQKLLPKDQFFQWLVRFNPLMYQSGQQWSNATIKEFIFCQNQQMVSSSRSSDVLSHHGMSHQSLSSSGVSSAHTSAKEKRNIHLGSYSQILGKEVGGISKSDMHGILFTMGTDSYGQLGLDAITTREAQNVNLKVLYPRMVLSLKDELIKEICCGHCHTLAINIHGQVFVWGLNESGQLGLGEDAPSTVRKPVLNQYLSNISKLSAGNEHSLAITKSGDLYIWGGGGLTGLGDINARPVPTKMDFFERVKIQQAVCGGLHTVVVTKEGVIYSWGSTEGGQLGLPMNIIAEICQGQDQPVLTPQRIPKFEGIHITQVACGEAHSIAMSKDGKLYGWGMSNYGQLGLGFSSDSFEPGVGMEKSKVYEPVEITGMKGESKVLKIICGATFSLFQTEKGDLFGCGMNDLGQLGLDTYMEELLGGTNGLEKVKRGRHTQASSDVTVPTKVICFQGIALHSIACGENHALAVSGDDKNMLWAWGMYRQGQLGLGEVTMKMNPRPVQTLCSSAIQKISCGSMHSLTLIGDPQQVSTLSSQYYSGANSFDIISNYWQCDIKLLGLKWIEDEYAIQQTYITHINDDGENLKKNDELPDDGEGQVKNPK